MKTHLTSLFALLLSRHNIAKLASLVDGSHQQFIDDGAEDVWWFWKGQVAIANGKPEDALALAPNISNPEQREGFETVGLRALAKKTGDLTRLSAHLEEMYTRTHDGLWLFELCEAKLEQKQWPFVADHANELLTLIGTTSALRMALEGAYQAGRPEQCLNLLREGEKLFPNETLPTDLKRLRVACESQLGLVSEAIREAEQVAGETGQLDDLSQVIGLKLAKADVKGAAETARAMLRRDDAKPEQLLGLARTIHVDDSHLAKELLSRAIESGERSADFVVAAYDLAFRLNREDIAQQLGPDFVKAAEAQGGPVQTLTLTQFLELEKSERERQAEAIRLYQQGRIPLHVLRKPLSAIYYERFHSTGEPLGKTIPVFIRYGGREAASTLPDIKHLYLDVTALLLAAQLEILDAVETQFAPLYIPPSITYALHRELEEAAPHQPSQIDEMRMISELLESGDLHIAGSSMTEITGTGEPLAQKLGIEWFSLYQQAQRQNGRVVTFLPLRYGLEMQLLELGENESRFTAGCGSVLESLVSEGKLTREAQNVARERLSGVTREERPSVLEKGIPLFLHGNIADTLASAGILRDTCQCFRVYIDASESDRVRAALRQAQEQTHLREWLRELRDRINRGLADGKYKFIPIGNSAKRDLSARQWGFEAACIEELVKAKVTVSGHAWVDDRFLSAFHTCGELPTVTVVDVLRELQRRKVIDRATFFHKLHQLRKGNFRYLPLDKEEILFRLQNARHEDGAIIETPELSVLRRYVASCLQDKDRLQLLGKAATPTQQGELRVLTSILPVVGAAISSLWCDESITDTAAIARADWILHNLWFDSGAAPRLGGAAPGSPEEETLIGGTLALLYFQAPTKLGKENTQAALLRMGYFDWLQDRFASSWEWNENLAQQLTKLIEGAVTQPNSKANKTALRALLGELYQDLPSRIRSPMHVSRKTLKRIGIRESNVVTIADLKFEDSEFWQTAQQVVRGEAKRIAALDPKQEFTMSFVSEGDGPTILLNPETPGKRFRMNDPLFDVLRSSVESREQVLRAHREWFDCDKNVREKQTLRLSRVDDPSKRITQIRNWRNNSAACFYANLETALAERRPLKLSDFEPPSSTGLLNHLRISHQIEPDKLAKVIEEASMELLDEEGFDEAFLRIASMPIALPTALSKAYTELSSTEQETWREYVVRTCSCPVTRLHVANLALRSRDRGTETAADIFDSLLGPEGEIEYSTFQHILRWTLPQLEQRKDTANWSPSVLLAVSWLHAGRLHNLLRRFSSKEKVAVFFKGIFPVHLHEAVESRFELLTDVAHPRVLTRTAFLSRGISHVLVDNGKHSTDIPRLVEQANHLCFLRVGDQWGPLIELMADPTLQRNALGSFLGSDQGTLLEPLVGSEGARVYSSSRIAATAEEVMSALLANPVNPQLWGAAFGVLGRTRAPDSLRERVRLFTATIEFAGLDKLDLQILRIALFTIINQVCSLGDEGIAARTKAELQKLFQRIAAKQQRTEDNRNYAGVLIECAQLLALRHSNPIAVARDLVDFLYENVVSWPAVADILQPNFTVLSYHFPPQVAVETWKLIFKIRETAK